MGYEFEATSGRIIEAAIWVHKTLGPGFVESVYENAMKIALEKLEIPYESQREVDVRFEGTVVGTHRLDMLVDDQIVVELKAVKAIEEIHFAQILSYLKATGRQVGLLLNFQSTTLQIRRVVQTQA